MIPAMFWLFLICIVYVYLLYPAAVLLLAPLRNKGVKKAPITPSVSIIIAAYNEEQCIGQTIDNKLLLDYPEGNWEVIIVSDGSTDRTDEIVRSYRDPRVRFVRQEQRRGKTAALNTAVLQARGDILVFSDANSLYAAPALTELVANFADPSVGYVTGHMKYVNADGSLVGDGCSGYMRYENFLRRAETAVGSIVGVDGGIDAMRKELYTPMRDDQLPDLVMPLRVVEQGSRVVYDQAAVLHEHALSGSTDEYRMRVRVSLRAFHALRDMYPLLNPAQYGLFAWQLLSHKVLRYGVFFFLAGAYISNLFAVPEGPVYTALFALQNAFYVSAAVGYYLAAKNRNLRLFYISFYFCLVNLASAHAFLKFLRNERQVVWVPRKG